MKSILVLLALAVLLTVPASAAVITYTTTGLFTCSVCSGSGTTAISFGSGGNTASLTFAGLTTATVNTPSNASLGDITSFATGTGAPVSGTFTLTLVQNLPPPTSGSPASFPATFSGTIDINTNSTILTFSTTSATIVSAAGTTVFTLQNPILLVPQTTNGGVTTLQSVVTFTPSGNVPEPTTNMMLGGGLTGIGLLLRKLRKV